MANQYNFGYQQYTPPSNNTVIPVGAGNGASNGSANNNNINGNVLPSSYSPTFSNSYFPANASDTSSTTSSISSSLGSSYSSNSSYYAFQNPRLRYYLSKSFDIEDDLEFCPDIPENYENSPPAKKFNPYTASVFSPTTIQEIYAAGGNNSPSNVAAPQSPRSRTPRIKKPLEIVNPQTKMRVSSSTLNK